MISYNILEISLLKRTTNGFKYLQEFVIGTIGTTVNSECSFKIRIQWNSCNETVDTLYKAD